MTVSASDIGQAHEQRRPDSARPGTADGGEMMSAGSALFVILSDPKARRIWGGDGEAIAVVDEPTVARPERGMVHLPTTRFLASLGMTGESADADQAHEQRRPDPARPRQAYGGGVMSAHVCHSEEQSDEESWAGTKKLLRLSLDQQVWNPLHRRNERSRTSSVPAQAQARRRVHEEIQSWHPCVLRGNGRHLGRHSPRKADQSVAEVEENRSY